MLEDIEVWPKAQNCSFRKKCFDYLKIGERAILKNQPIGLQWWIIYQIKADFLLNADKSIKE